MNVLFLFITVNTWDLLVVSICAFQFMGAETVTHQASNYYAIKKKCARRFLFPAQLLQKCSQRTENQLLLSPVANKM